MLTAIRRSWSSSQYGTLLTSRTLANIALAASDVTFGPDPNKVITPTIQYGLDIIRTAASIPTIKRFVYTSSSTAATMPYPNKKFTIEQDSWDEPAVKQAWAPAPYEPTRSYAVYAASKTQTEQALWKFVQKEKPGFVLNTGTCSFENYLELFFDHE